ncbi:major facilitator superfamily domain-containing protein [Mycena belliarum]|uniref:Major facilitator superfamily domain-containing protein n=1 Tax=Mycena belliarum TaxID=1033014 RepID=A0AAD6UCD2_9AGAR|nr:major facilitator superfamily domain-containing protein [Mycena belliae]
MTLPLMLVTGLLLAPSMSSIASTNSGKRDRGFDEKQDPFTTSLEPVLEETEVGYDLYKEALDERITWDSGEEKVLLRKLAEIDARILPFFCITQGLAFLDKTALNYANLFHIKTDMHITTAQFSWFASIFYIGYLVSAEPMAWMLQRYPTGRVLGLICFLWGIIVMTTAASRSFAGTMINRFILGALESCVTPGLGLMTPFWWRLDEQPVRHLTWYSFNGVAGIAGDFLAYSLGHAVESKVPRWALIFLVLGGFTACWGAVLFLTLPDSPAVASFLSQRERNIAIKRVAENRTGTKNKVFKHYQLIQAFRDPKTYILFIASIAAQIPNGVVSNFSSIIISDMGFTAFQTTLLDIPSNIFQITSLVLSGYLAGRFKNSRALMMFIGNTTCIIAAAALTYAPRHEKWGRLVAFWFTSFQSVGFSLSLVMISANVGGFTKRQVTTVVTFIGYCVGNIVGPHVLLQSESKIGYPTATKAMMSGYVIKTACHLILGYYMWNSNRLRDRDAAASGENVSEEERARRAEDEGMKDVTEFDNKWFRYVI